MIDNISKGPNISNYASDKRVKTPIALAKEIGDINFDQLEKSFKEEIAKAYLAGGRDMELNRTRRLQDKYYSDTYI